MFEYPGHWAGVVIAGTKGKEIAEFIRKAKEGNFPSLRSLNQFIYD
ncbi:MAG: hypothetical protein IJ631_02350 [Schwartzia sp.]|nr:hypothetical protein [Schwartzia sp. (in: firmicutes)]